MKLNEMIEYFSNKPKSPYYGKDKDGAYFKVPYEKKDVDLLKIPPHPKREYEKLNIPPLKNYKK